MVLLAPPRAPAAAPRPAFGACGPGACRARQVRGCGERLARARRRPAAAPRHGAAGAAARARRRAAPGLRRLRPGRLPRAPGEGVWGCGGVRAGQSASLALAAAPPPRPGMVLLAPPRAPAAAPRPAFGACGPGACRARQVRGCGGVGGCAPARAPRSRSPPPRRRAPAWCCWRRRARPPPRRARPSAPAARAPAARAR
ncbi:unnamed protein product [Euphydryas editha]|uniref:Uncharacterized protein n=1 Tax=Euphydryas editha TaxID=104508 RepID=A0AAU9TCS2_EUPED|nr:unnamed protein product [Euphydryas editha]